MLSILLALAAGVVTILTPCTLPVLPILLGSAFGQTSRWRPAFIAAGFVSSFSAVAILLAELIQVLDFDPNILRTLAAILLLGFGLLMIIPAAFSWLPSPFSNATSGNSASHTSNISGFILGTTLGLVWTPCAGPVLGSILSLVATSRDIGWASLMLIAYTIGAAIPMLGIAYGGQAVTTRLRRFGRVAPQLQKAFGAIVIGFAIASYYQYDTQIVAWLTGFYPSGLIGL